MKYIKSPIFYMGNKYELLPQLLDIFPKNIKTFHDVFGGSGVVSMNVNADFIEYNELNHNVIQLIRLFKNYTSKEIIEHIKMRIKEFNLDRQRQDVRQNNVTEKSRKKAQKSYLNFRDFYNKDHNNYLDLYTLTFYSFCNLMRFNSKNEFNMPYGNRCYRDKMHKHIIEQACFTFKNKDIMINNRDVFVYLNSEGFEKDDFIYLDPPYLNTEAIYNEKRAFGGWTIEHDLELFEILDYLDSRGIRWCLSNVKENKGKTNDHLIKWAESHNYRVIGMNKNYSALGKGNANTYEICVINYNYDGDGFKIIQERLF